MLIQSFHRGGVHCGVSQTLNSIRTKFWIPQNRSVVKKVIGTCSFCKKAEGGPYRMPDMVPLPSARVWESALFSNRSLGYLGPLQYKENGELKKAWVCLFMCMLTRAIHLEMVTNMTTDAVLTVSVFSWPAETFRNKLYQKGLSGASL